MFNQGRAASRWPSSALRGRARVPQYLFGLEEDEYRDLLVEMRYSEKAIEQELERFRQWKQAKEPSPRSAQETREPSTDVERIARRAKSNREEKGHYYIKE